jgi:NADPH:quinone reductase-like Zn-dependent oxidoreductase
MKAMQIGKPATLDSIKLANVEARAPGRGEIKVRIRASSLNFRDYIVATGMLPSREGAILLSDGAGEVAEVGEGVTEFKPGDAVVAIFHPAWQGGHIDRGQQAKPPGADADGCAAEYVTRLANTFTHAPKGWSHAESATLTCAGVTAWRAIVDGPVKSGSTVLIQGTGGVSIFALQFAKAAGATVIATSSTADKLARLKALGADHVINYNETKEWSGAVVALTNGLGVDHIVEVGGPNTMDQSLKAARTGGHIAVIGAVAGFQSNAIPFAIVQAQRLRLQGVTVGSRADQIDMIRAIDANGLKAVVDSSFPLEKLADAFRYMNGGSFFGKICIDI